MAHDAGFKRRVRARMAETGEKITTARRALLDDPKQAVEAYYLFTPPGTIEYVTSSTRTELQPPEQAGPAFSWGYAGSGPNTASWAVLEHATGDCDLRFAIAFTEDTLDRWDELSDRVFALTSLRFEHGAGSASHSSARFRADEAGHRSSNLPRSFSTTSRAARALLRGGRHTETFTVNRKINLES